jgi:hypothetical protein
VLGCSRNIRDSFRCNLDIVVRTPLAAVAGIVDRCRRSTMCKVVVYALVFFLILYARRSDQLIHPQVPEFRLHNDGKLLHVVLANVDVLAQTFATARKTPIGYEPNDEPHERHLFPFRAKARRKAAPCEPRSRDLRRELQWVGRRLCQREICSLIHT